MDNFSKLFLEPRKPPHVVREGTGAIDKPFSDMVKSKWYEYMQIGIQYYAAKEYYSALAHLNNAIQENPHHPHLLKIRANIKEDSGDPGGAIADYKDALNETSEDWYSTYNQIAINYLKLKNFARALIAFNIAIELKEGLAGNGIDEAMLATSQDGVMIRIAGEKMYTNRANVKLTLKDFQGCLADCRKAIDINPQYANAYFIAGILYSTIGQTDESLKVLEHARSLGHKLAASAINDLLTNI